jgi:predicted secreted hydrolase
MLGHFALADPRRGQLLHAEQAWRVTPGVADYSTEDCQLQMGAWSMRRHGSGRQERIATRASAPKFTADLELAPTSDPWLQGSSGFSAKGASGQEASYYYSRPQLTLTGSIAIEGKSAPVKGQAWFDHEWSSTLLNPDAKGWDWVGINLFDGQSLMAFRIHGAQGKTLFRTANTLRGSDDVQWEVLNTWRSPRTAATYPVSQRLRSEQLGELTLIPIMADQELDARQGTGLVYWEGLVAVMQGSRLVGRGYLEMTGYAGQITF